MDIRLNKKAAVLAGGVVSMACLVACGDDITQITNVGMDTVAAYEDLSECTAQNEGVLIYVKDKGNTYLCSDESWHSVKGEDGKNGSDGKNGTNGKNGSDGKNGSSCSAKATDDGIQVSCGGTVIGTLTNGTDGDDCTVAEVANGAEVTCGTSKVTIKNGTNGSNGTNGTNGDDCTVSKTGGVATVVCGASSVQISDGSAGANCSVAETEDGATITCGSNVVTVPKGAAGTNGKSAYELAVEKGYTGTLTEWIASLKGVKGDAGENCTFVTGDNDGEIVLTCGEKQTTLYKAVCGTTPYDPAAKFCVGVKLYDLCGGLSFDPEHHECVENVVQEIVMENCGEATYNPKKEFCATRDNVVERIYKKVIIGEGENAQTWMAENLNYTTASSWCGGGSGTTEGNCTTYGRLYTWAAAKTACPDGWHLPSKTEFEKLITNVDADLNGSYNFTNKAGTALKSTSGWNGTNESGFSALPAGERAANGYFYYEGENADFWSFSEINSLQAYYMHLYSSNDGAILRNNHKDTGYPVRCLKD